MEHGAVWSGTRELNMLMDRLTEESERWMKCVLIKSLPHYYFHLKL